MRALNVARAALLAASAGALTLTCDLFHSTEFPTLCDLDAKAPGCVPETSTDASPFATSFCGMDSNAASASAEHACAWLSACEPPIGSNAFGPCMIEALLAFDCNINPNRAVVGTLHDYWDALRQAKSCTDVDRAVFPGGVPPCGTGNVPFVGCGVKSGTSDNASVRIECDEVNAAPRGGENCVAEGQTCTGGQCSGFANGTCALSGCEGRILHDCLDSQVDSGADAAIDGGAGSVVQVDRGTDCSLFGAGMCEVSDAGPACVPSGGSPCAPTSTVNCSEGVAHGCPSGTSETIDCNALTGNDSCNAGPAAPAWDVSSACFVAGDAATCGADMCTGSDMLTSCARGHSFSVACSEQGLGACSMVTTFDHVLRAVCGRSN